MVVYIGSKGWMERWRSEGGRGVDGGRVEDWWLRGGGLEGSGVEGGVEGQWGGEVEGWMGWRGGGGGWVEGDGGWKGGVGVAIFCVGQYVPSKSAMPTVRLAIHCGMR